MNVSTSNPGLLGPLNLENFLLGLNIGQSILVNVLHLRYGGSLQAVILLVVLVEQWVLQICHRDAVPLEEPLLEFLDHGRFQ